MKKKTIMNNGDAKMLLIGSSINSSNHYLGITLYATHGVPHHGCHMFWRSGQSNLESTLNDSTTSSKHLWSFPIAHAEVEPTIQEDGA